MKEYLYYDKEPVGSRLPNRTLMFGEGVFETFRYKQKLPVFFLSHLERLKESSRYVGIKYPGDFYIETLIENFVKEHKSNHFNNLIKDFIIKVALFSSGDSAYFGKSNETLVCVSIKEEDVKPNSEISLTIAQTVRCSTNSIYSHKTLNYLSSVIERREALKRNFDDALFINEKNLVVETTAGNIFWIKGPNVFTPSLSNGPLKGITRGIIKEICLKNKIRFYEGDYEAGSILFPEAIFVTNSAQGILEVINLDNTTKPTRTQKIFPQIKEELLKLLEW